MHAAPCSQSYSFVSDYVGPEFLWFTAKCQERTVAMWKAIAARYANQNVIAGYDLINESVTTDAKLLDLYRRTTAAIRQVDGNHLLIYEGNTVAQTFDFMTAPLDANAMLSVHDYTTTSPATSPRGCRATTRRQGGSTRRCGSASSARPGSTRSRST